MESTCTSGRRMLVRICLFRETFRRLARFCFLFFFFGRREARLFGGRSGVNGSIQHVARLAPVNTGSLLPGMPRFFYTDCSFCKHTRGIAGRRFFLPGDDANRYPFPKSGRRRGWDKVRSLKGLTSSPCSFTRARHGSLQGRRYDRANSGNVGPQSGRTKHRLGRNHARPGGAAPNVRWGPRYVQRAHNGRVWWFCLIFSVNFKHRGE